VAKTTVICIKFLLDVTCQKYLKLASVSHSYLENISDFFFMAQLDMVIIDNELIG